jgi:phosphoribosylcarboxyaminoimidazole (NCAIR) mutase
MPLVGVVIGSKSDTEAVQPTLDVLKELGIDYEVSVTSAHRTPEKARQYALSARERLTCLESWLAGLPCR